MEVLHTVWLIISPHCIPCQLLSPRSHTLLLALTQGDMKSRAAAKKKWAGKELCRLESCFRAGSAQGTNPAPVACREHCSSLLHCIPTIADDTARHSSLPMCLCSLPCSECCPPSVALPPCPPLDPTTDPTPSGPQKERGKGGCLSLCLCLHCCTANLLLTS